MILSHVILFSSFIKNQSINYNTEKPIYSIKKELTLQRTNNQYILASLKVPNSNNNSSQYDRIMHRNLWQKFFNNYLQETVFLSSSNDKSIKYINKLKMMGLSVYDTNQYRRFLYKFNKNLLQNNIEVTSNNNVNFNQGYSKSYNDLYFKYNWLKVFKLNNDLFPFLNKNISFFNNNSLPLFILVNNNNEVIMSESTSLLPKSRYLNNKFLNLQSKRYFYTCLLFINHNDALEYKNYIKYQNVNSSHRLNLRIVPINIGLYNKLMSNKQNLIDFRLIPDLKEVSNLLYIYSKYSNIYFNINQYRGHGFFQGQPLYQIMLSRKNKIFKNQDLYLLTKNNKHNYSNILFLNYKTAIHAWDKLVKDNPSIGLPKNPQISVSNLESFIHNQKTEADFQYFMFLPSLENYKFIKEYLLINIRQYSGSSHWIKHNSGYIKTICCRIFWSLTSRQPSGW